MRMLLVSEDLSAPADEGLKKFVSSITTPLRSLVQLEVVSTQPAGPVGDGVTVARANLLMGGRELRDRVRTFRPTHIVYVPRSGGTRNAFIRSWRLGRIYPAARRTTLILQSRSFGAAGAFIARMLRPDVLLTQGPSVRRAISRAGLDALDIPSGVDTCRFSPASIDQKLEIRRRLGIPADSPVVLHVGHLAESRNVLLLAKVRQDLGCEAIVVGSTSTPHNAEVKDLLEASGVRVFDTYIEEIADIYRAVDCYLFPVHNSGGAIEMPLSVLEAMACGIPVVSTPFGSLPDWLPPSSGVVYADADHALIREVGVALLAGPELSERVRSSALQFSWATIAERLIELAADTKVEDQPELAAVASRSTKTDSLRSA